MNFPRKHVPYVIPSTREFLRANWWRCFLISALLILPCLWQRHIEACDLASHVYNVWLAQLIHQGKAPGLWIASQWSNTLFDRLLEGSIGIFGFAAGEKFVVICSVLTFFWGLFALASAAAGRAAWLVVPMIAAFSYGWIFSMGFMNLYLAMGLLFFLLAIVWRGLGIELVLILPLFIAISMAHMLGIAAALSIGIFLSVQRLVRVRLVRLGLAVMSLLIVLVGRQYVTEHYLIYPRASSISWMAGTDQLFLYRREYLYISMAIMVFAVGFAVFEIFQPGVKQLAESSTWLTLLSILVITVAVLPGGFHSPKNGPMGLLPERASAFTAAVLCCVLAIYIRRAWQTGVLSILVVAFFVLYYQDTTQLNNTEMLMERVVRELPAGSRIVTGIELSGSRVLSGHMLDRACIGYCYSYANYEIGSQQFRIKGIPGNGIITTSYDDSLSLQSGDYVPSQSDPPLYELTRCETRNGLCVVPYTR
jgi:hypothetical protein